MYLTSRRERTRAEKNSLLSEGGARVTAARIHTRRAGSARAFTRVERAELLSAVEKRATQPRGDSCTRRKCLFSALRPRLNYSAPRVFAALSLCRRCCCCCCCALTRPPMASSSLRFRPGQTELAGVETKLARVCSGKQPKLFARGGKIQFLPRCAGVSGFLSWFFCAREKNVSRFREARVARWMRIRAERGWVFYV